MQLQLPLHYLLDRPEQQDHCQSATREMDVLRIVAAEDPGGSYQEYQHDGFHHAIEDVDYGES